MDVVYAPECLEHAPRGELKNGVMIAARECPERAVIVRDALSSADGFSIRAPGPAEPERFARIHDARYLAFLKQAWPLWRDHLEQAGEPLCDAVPLTFPTLRQRPLEPDAITGKLGYYAIDAGTPITPGAWTAAAASAQCALKAQALVQAGARAAFALCRPPGHHAGTDMYGGYCFLNNAALAAQAILDAGAERIAVLDVDYHHGNGTQSIFYERGDVLTISIHADPLFEYPFFLGHARETGAGAGENANLNLPLQRGATWPSYADALEEACARIDVHGPDAVIVSWGFDTFIDDPLSTFQLRTEDFTRLGARIGALDRPVLVCLEGGYATQALGANVLAGLSGLANELR